MCFFQSIEFLSVEVDPLETSLLIKDDLTDQPNEAPGLEPNQYHQELQEIKQECDNISADENCEMVQEQQQKYTILPARQIHEPKKFVCCLCGVGFNFKSNATRHLRVYHMKLETKEQKEQKKTKENCEMVQEQELEVQEQEQEQEAEAEQEQPREQQQEVVQEIGPNLFVCRQCGAIFKVKSNATRHYKHKHKQKMLEIETKIKDMQENAGNRETDKNMEEPEKEQNTEEYCEMEQEQDKVVQKIGPKKFVCRLCGNEFKDQHKATVHYKIKHLGMLQKHTKKKKIGVFPCNMCNDTFSTAM